MTIPRWQCLDTNRVGVEVFFQVQCKGMTASNNYQVKWGISE